MTERGPFKVKSSKQVYKNPWIEVREDAVVRPDGNNGIFGILSVFPGVSVLPMDREGNVYLTEEYHYGAGEHTIEVVSGGIDEGEDKLAGGKRELREETGFTAEEWIYLGYVRPLTTVMDHINHLYLARTLIEGPRDPSEILNVMKVPFATAHTWAMEGKIIHCASTVVILKAAEFLRSNP